MDQQQPALLAGRLERAPVRHLAGRGPGFAHPQRL